MPSHVAFGWKEDAPDPRDYRASDRLKTGVTVPLGPPSLLRHRNKRLEQWYANSCVAFSLTRAIDLVNRAHNEFVSHEANYNPPLASPTFLYHNGLLQEYKGMDPRTAPPITDEGCHPRYAMQATRELGYVTWDDLPYDDKQVLKPISPDLYWDAYDQRGFIFHRVTDLGQSRIDQVAEGLRRGMGVIFGMPVDKAYIEHVGSESIKAIDLTTRIGNHMQAVLEVEPSGVVLIDNWWGPTLGVDGMYRFTPELFGSNLISDCYLIESVPLLLGTV